MSRTNPLERLKQINKICDDFEDRLQCGNSPAIETVLDKSDVKNRSQLLTELMRLELFYLNEQGKRPEIDSYYKRFPDDRDEVVGAFDATANDRFDETDPSPSASLQRSIGDRIGRFQIEALLGSGAFSEVYLAHDPNYSHPVAIKVMKRFDESQRKTSHDRVVQSISEESETLTKLSHPAIAQFYELDNDEFGLPFVVMEYVKGDSLEFLLREKLVDTESAIKIVARVADSLAYVHQQDVFHRDLKPANIIVGLDGHPRIVDFGLAVHESTQYQLEGEVAGSVAYMSPEQLRGHAHRIDGRTDVWSLGVMLYEILTSRLPFRGATRQALNDEILHRSPRPPRQINDQISAELESICFKALEKDSRLRFLTAQDFSDSLSSHTNELDTRLAGASGVRAITATGRAELRLASQARTWSENPENRRLPTLLQYLRILYWTDSQSRTVTELRMMHSAFSYYLMRLSTVATLILLAAISFSYISKTTKISAVNRERQRTDWVSDLGFAKNESEFSEYCSLLAPDKEIAVPKIVTELSSTMKDPFRNGESKNYLNALFNDSGLSYGAHRSHDKFERQIRDSLDGVLFNQELNVHGLESLWPELDSDVVKTINAHMGLAEKKYCFCVELPWLQFRDLSQDLAKFHYKLQCIDVFKLDGESLASAVWLRHGSQTPYTNLSEREIELFNSGRHAKSNFDIVGCFRPDYFCGSSGVDGLVDVRVTEIPFPKTVSGRIHQYEQELALANKMLAVRENKFNWFLKARALCYLKRFNESVDALSACEAYSKSFAKSWVFAEISTQVYAALGDESRSIVEYKKLIPKSNEVFKTATNAKRLILLGRLKEAEENLNQDSDKIDMARAYSCLAEHWQLVGDSTESMRCLEIAKGITDRSTKTAFTDVIVLASPDLEFLRSHVDDVRIWAKRSTVLQYSGVWEADPNLKTRFTDGKQNGKYGYRRTPKQHLVRANKFREDGFVPVHIDTSVNQFELPEHANSVVSLWQKRSNEHQLDYVEQSALAAVGRIKAAIENDQVFNNLKIYQLLKRSNDLTLQSEMILTFAKLQVDIPDGILQVLGEFETEPSIQYGLLAALCLYDKADLQHHRESILKTIRPLRLANSDPGVNSLCEWLMTELQNTADHRFVVDSNSGTQSTWQINSTGIKMINVGKIWMSAAEISEDEYCGVFGKTNSTKPGLNTSFDHSFYDFAKLCNKLSALEGIPEEQWCFTPNDDDEYADGMIIKPNFKSLTGYRPATFTEWQEIYKQQTSTAWPFGNNKSHGRLFGWHYWSVENDDGVRQRPGREKLPNQYGFFDMGGNALEWTMTTVDGIPESGKISDKMKFRLCGGCSWYTMDSAEVGASIESSPNTRSQYCGFRVVRKIQ